MTPVEHARSVALLAGGFLMGQPCEGTAPDIALILGTGWGDALKLQDPREIPLAEIPGFPSASMQAIPGHARTVVFGDLAGKHVIALRGRIHLNEHPTDPNIPLMVRLQVQMLLELGVKKFILTNAAGSLIDKCKVGNIVIADGFITVFAPAMPLFAGEFCSPEDRLSSRMREIAQGVGAGPGGDVLCRHQGGYAMLRGPFFEGRRYDKKLLAEIRQGRRPNRRRDEKILAAIRQARRQDRRYELRTLTTAGASAVGMSTLPEACIIALYPDTEALCLSFITNSASEEHSHEANQARAKESSALLGDYLADIISKI